MLRKHLENANDVRIADTQRAIFACALICRYFPQISQVEQSQIGTVAQERRLNLFSFPPWRISTFEVFIYRGCVTIEEHRIPRIPHWSRLAHCLASQPAEGHLNDDEGTLLPTTCNVTYATVLRIAQMSQRHACFAHVISALGKTLVICPFPPSNTLPTLMMPVPPCLRRTSRNLQPRTAAAAAGPRSA
jgi:hypothetical protein